MSAVSITGTHRSSCWSITINNPTEQELQAQLPAGWRIEGQLEQGEQGTTHYQAMLRTPQVRFSAVKQVFPRAHIEVAKNPKALAAYVHKEETRLREVESRQSDIPTLWDFQTTIANMWDYELFEKFCERVRLITKGDEGEAALLYIDSLVNDQIRQGVKGVEFIAINPLWRSSWKRFWRSILFRNKKYNASQAQLPQAIDEAPAPDVPESPQGCA